MKSTKERVFSLTVRPKDYAVMILSSALSIVVMGIILTRDVTFGILIAFASVVTYGATCCLYFNPNKHTQQNQSSQEPEDNAGATNRHQRTTNTALTDLILSVILLLLGKLMLTKSDVWVVTGSGDSSPILTFGDMRHSSTCGWIIISGSVYFLLLALAPLLKWLRHQFKSRKDKN